MSMMNRKMDLIPLEPDSQASFDEQYLFFIDERYFCSLVSMKDQKNIFRIIPEYDLLNFRYLAIAIAKILQQRDSLNLVLDDGNAINLYTKDQKKIYSILVKKEYQKM